MYIFVYIHMCVSIYICTYIYIHMYTYKYICTQGLSGIVSLSSAVAFPVSLVASDPKTRGSKQGPPGLSEEVL